LAGVGSEKQRVTDRPLLGRSLLRLKANEARLRSDASVVAGIAIVASVSVVAVVPKVDVAIRGSAAVQESIAQNDLAQIPATHVNKDCLLLHPMTDVRTVRSVKLITDAIRDVVTP
jgi:hypothetical protein